MKIEVIDPKSGQIIIQDAPNLNDKTINDFLNTTNKTRKEIKSWINKLEISADAKAILNNIAQTTFRVGEVIVRIGLKILDIVSYLLKNYPNASVGVIFGFFVGTLAATIPLIGLLIGPFVVALSTILFGVIGYREDLLDKSLKRKIQEYMADFNTLQTN